MTAALAFAGLLLSKLAARHPPGVGAAVESGRLLTVLLTDGVLAGSRNPMFVGMLLVVAGEAVMPGTLGALLPLPVFVLVLRLGFIDGEERLLESTFGARPTPVAAACGAGCGACDAR